MTESAESLKLRHELASIRSYLAAAQYVMKTGHMPLLIGLEDRVALLCEMIREAPPHEQKGYLTELTSLVENLNETERSIKANAPAPLPE